MKAVKKKKSIRYADQTLIHADWVFFYGVIMV